MKIVSVERDKRSARRFIVRLEDGSSFSVHEDTLVGHRLLKGGRMEAQQIEEVLRDDVWRSAYRAALKFLGRRPRTRKEVLEKLTGLGFALDVTHSVVAALIEQGYVDDSEFARRWVEERVVSRKKGRLYVQCELERKGVAREQIARAFDQLEEGAEAEGAFDLLCRRWPLTSGDPAVKKRRLVQYLLRRGYAPSVIRQAFRLWHERRAEHDNKTM
jgi:regulatory protein